MVGFKLLETLSSLGVVLKRFTKKCVSFLCDDWVLCQH